tara:strand:+ start:30142 stop:31254 length:1113 start_codon:yes stop_codon:yes gene_type:complete
MTKPNLESINLQLDTANLVQTSDGRFTAIGALPAWLSDFGCSAQSEEPFQLESHLLFFDTYLLEVRDRLLREPDAVISSGPWSETDNTGLVRNLSALALQVDGQLVIQIKLIPRKQQYQQAIFQQARNYSLKFEQLVREREHKEILLHTIIHDLAGPLTSIHGVLELMERGRTSSQLTTIGLEQCQVQKRMIGTILDTFVSLDSSNALPGSRSEAPDVIFSAQQAYAKFQPAFENKKVTLRLSLEPHEQLIKVVAEEDLLERVFANLLENALRHSDEGSTTELKVELSADRVVVSVLDEGTGISSNVIASLFDRYTSSGDNAGNIGLGLYFCKIVLERWKGSLKCENRTDTKGSLFQFELLRFDSKSESI